MVAEEAASQVELAQSKIGKLAAAQREAATAHAEQQAAMASAQDGAVQSSAGGQRPRPMARPRAAISHVVSFHK